MKNFKQNREICMTQNNFETMEKDILDKITKISKALIETLKFRMIYGVKVSEKQNKKTLKTIKDFRSKNWDKNLSRKKAYKKYLN